jgi:GNAT superfamily N-acetyltransferase
MAYSNDLADRDALSIAALDASHAPAIAQHLHRLSAEDRCLRFCAGTVPDAVLAKYVSSIRFGDDTVLGAIGGDGRIVALGHACWFRSAEGLMAEAAFSVDEGWRSRGLARRLLAAIRAVAAERDAAAVLCQCMARNRPMRRVMAAAGMTIEVEDGEVSARGAALPAGACSGLPC